MDTVKTIKDAEYFFSLLENMYVFTSCSYGYHIVDMDTAPRELQRLSNTRWRCRYLTCKTVRDRLQAIICVLEEIAQEHNGERAVDAHGLLSQIDLHFFGLLYPLSINVNQMLVLDWR